MQKFKQVEGGNQKGRILYLPSKCDICGYKGNTTIIDGKTHAGPWAYMCVDCHKDYGLGLGIGVGQKYERVDD